MLFNGLYLLKFFPGSFLRLLCLLAAIILVHKFVRNLITEWRKLELPFSGQTFIVAVSGGADSISLLAALHDLKERKKLGLRFVVAHFNHNLRGPESDADESFVKQLTAKLGFELAVGHGNIPKEGNLEQNARNARYAFLKETAENVKACGVLTAHTMNDQAETFLMNLIRGSGVDGLSGMRSVRSFEFRVSSSELETDSSYLESGTRNSKLLLVRPLLTWAKRIDTENFCRENGIEFRYDTMNEDMAFRRVRIRKMLIPMLVDFNPKIIETLAKTANLMRKEAVAESVPGAIATFERRKEKGERINEESETSSLSLAVASGTDNDFFADRELTVKLLTSLPKSDLYRALRIWLKHKRGNLRSLELNHIEAIERLILSRKSGRIVELPNGETVIKQDGMLLFKRSEFKL